MNTARTAQLTGLAALAALALAGCGTTAADSEPSGAAASTAPADPRTVLFDAVPDAQDGAYRFDLKGGDLPMSGVVDVAHKATELKAVQREDGLTMTMSFLVIDEQFWTRIAFKPADVPGLPKFGKKWLLLDESKVEDKDIRSMQAESDPGNAALLVDKATNVKETGAGRYAGFTDLVEASEAEILDEAALAALGDKAKAVPFEAVVDADGHLTELTVRVPAAGKAKAQTYVISYTGFGATATPSVPAAHEQTTATAAVYEMLNS